MSPAAKRVMVFIDYQNVYNGAREAFGSRGDPHMFGQIHPLRLGLVLKGAGNGPRELAGVRIYRGMPSNAHDTACGSRQVRARTGRAGCRDRTGDIFFTREVLCQLS